MNKRKITCSQIKIAGKQKQHRWRIVEESENIMQCQDCGKLRRIKGDLNYATADGS